MVFGLPEGRELHVLSRHSNWVLIEDPSSKQVGWIEETALAPAGAEQQTAQEQAATPPQRPSRSAAQGAWMLEEEDIGQPDEMAEPAPRPRKWGRRGGRFAGGLRRALRGAF
jgi:hypothetical protein